MKKTLMIISIILLSQIAKSQSNITDTAQYLIDSIEAKKTDFIGSNFSYFANKLQLSIKYYDAGMPFPQTPDTLLVNELVIFFTSINDVVAKDYFKQKNPHVIVTFATPVLIPKAYLKKGGLMDAGTEWNSAKANFFANRVISQVNVFGL